MEYRQLGKSGLHVSALSFGTMTMGSGDSFKHMGNTPVEEARHLVDLCFEAGINLFDTADMYSQGESEEIIGAAIGKERREKAIIATKAFFRTGPGIHDIGLSRKHLIQACEASLKRLKTDYIDLYQVHLWDALTPIEETLSALNRLVQDGKVRYIGCSNFSGWHLMKALAYSDKCNFERFISHQAYYSLLHRELENEIIPLAIDQQVGILVWSPLSFGLLTGKYRKDKKEAGDTRLAHMQAPGHLDWDLLDRLVVTLEEIAKARDKTVPQVALNWLLRRPAIASLIFGARNESQLMDNLGAVGWKLSEEEVRQLENAGEAPGIYPYWHQHDYGIERNPINARAYNGE